MTAGLTGVLGRALERHVPLTVLFELTNRCNEDCEHCYVDLGDLEGELTTEEVERVLGELREAGTLFVTFTGGEIFTRRDTLRLIRTARRLGLALRLFTNGTLLDEAKVAAIAEAGVVAVELSVYSMDPERHDHVTRVSGSHIKTLYAARLLRERGIPTVLKSPVMAGMAGEYRRVIEFASGIGAEYRFDPSLVVRNDLDASPLQHRLGNPELVGLCVDPHLGLAIEPGSGAAPDPDGPICSTARRLALISARGLVFPCSQRFPPAGDLRRQSFRQIWEGSPLLMKLRNITARDLPVCSGCHNNAFCGRCSLDALFEDGNFWGASSWSCGLSEARQQAHEHGGTTMREMLAERARHVRSCDH